MVSHFVDPPPVWAFWVQYLKTRAMPIMRQRGMTTTQARGQPWRVAGLGWAHTTRGGGHAWLYRFLLLPGPVHTCTG